MTYTITFSNAGCAEHTERRNRRDACRLARYLVGNGYDRARVTRSDYRGRPIAIAAWTLDESGRTIRVSP